MNLDLSRLTFDPKKHAYYLDGKLVQGVTSILEGTSSKGGLVSWAANEAIDSIRDNADPGNIENGFDLDTWDRLLEQGRTAYARKRDKAADKGTDIHERVEQYINSCIESFDGKAILKSEIDPTRPFEEWAVSNNIKFLAAEQRLYSETHKIAGTADFIAEIDGELVIGDLKVKAKIWDTDPYVQTAAYALMLDEMSGLNAKKTYIVRMCDPQDPRVQKYRSAPFEVLRREAIEEDKAEFLRRLASYRYRLNYSPK